VTPRRTIHELLAVARSRLRRLGPHEALCAARDEGAILVDTRTEDECRRDGVIPGAVRVRLSELEWHLDPASGFNDPAIGLDAWIVVVCAEGYSSSLAAARLQALGFARATDLDGGFEAWKQAGLPVGPAPT
jgi:rhodanese-related sulfurtransferase